jgi:DNA-binding SARP family transcriptional activator
VVDAAVAEIIATGTFEDAAPFLDGSAGPGNRPTVLILQSRLEFGRGRIGPALALARAAVEGAAGGRAAGTALLNLAGLQGVAGYSDDGVSLAKRALEAELSDSERAIAQAIVSVRSLADDGDLEEGALLLRNLAGQQVRDGQHRYAAITLLILSSALTWLGRPEEALDAAYGAGVEIIATGARGVELVSIVLAQATALLHLGRREQADAALLLAAKTGSDLTSDEIHLETGRLSASLGDRDAAEQALSRIAAEDLPDGYAAIYAETMLTLALRRRAADEARGRLEVLRRHVPTEIAARLQVEIAVVRVALLNNEDAAKALEVAMGIAKKQQSRPGRVILELLADAAGDRAIHEAVARMPEDLSYCASLVAEEIAHAAHRLSSTARQRIEREIGLRPERWREALLTEIVDEGPSAAACAAMLVHIGTRDDAAALRAAAAKLKDLRPAALALTVKLAASVVVHDLGPVSIDVANARVRVVRRKVLALLCFLITRPNMAATRDEILEALWADLAPDAAGNSLHQTIYFLRRVFEPDFREGLSARYVNYDGDIARLNPELIATDSRHCWKAIENAPLAPGDVMAILTTYRGRFALDFAYEEWAADYRDTLHAAVLSAAESAMQRASEGGDLDSAVRIAQRILDVDPEADGIEAVLLRAYKEAGRTAAAAEQYAHYASALRDDLGVDTPPLEDL